MKCPKCHRDTYSAKWGQCTVCGAINSPKVAINTGPAINEERLTDAINTVVPAINGSTESGVGGLGSNVGAPAARPQATAAVVVGDRARRERHTRSEETTTNRRSREAYNTYMRDYMKAYRGRRAG